MATHTAQILIGRSHPEDGGLAGPSLHSPILLLSENSRPSWILHPGFRLQRNQKTFRAASKYVLIPSLETTLEDGFALMALIVCHELDWSESARSVADTLINEQRLEMYKVDAMLREDLLHEVRSHSGAYPKTVISVFQKNSLVHDQIHTLTNFKNEMAVCLPVFNRDMSRWSKSPNESGSLESNR